MSTRSATAILTEIREGQAVVELSEAIKAALAAVREHGKPATVTLDLTIRPPLKGMEKLTDPPIVFTAEVSSKLPKAEPEQTLFFLDADGNPTRNPAQREGSLNLTVAKGA